MDNSYIRESRRQIVMLWTIMFILLAVWAIGFIVGIDRGVINLLLVIAGMIFIAKLFDKRSSYRL